MLGGRCLFQSWQTVGQRSTWVGGEVIGHLQSAGREHLLGAGGQVVQAGPDVLTVVVALLLIKGGLHAQALESGLELQQLCFPPLPTLALVADVLGVGDQGRGESTLPGRRASRPDSGPRTTYCEDLQDKQEEEDFKAVFSRRRTTSRIPPQTLKGCFRASLLLRSNSSKACFLVKERSKNTPFPD